MSQLFTETVLIAIVASGIRLAVPLLLASLGEMFGQRSGVLNLGVDGIMLLGAFSGYYMVLRTGNVWLGLLMGAFIGLLLGLASALISVTLKAEQGISGIGVFLFGLGMSDLLFQKMVGTPIPIASFPDVHIPLLSEIPIIGGMLFQHSMVVYLAFAAVPISMFVLNRTTFGLNIKAVGENPEAADSLGRQRRQDPLRHGHHRRHLRRLRRRCPRHRSRDLPAEPHQRSGLHRHRTRLLRRMASDRRDGRERCSTDSSTRWCCS